MTGRVTAVWSGFAGGPGVSNFYFPDPASPTEAAAQVSKVREWLNGLKAYLPLVCSIQVNSEVVIFSSTLGTAQSIVVGTGTVGAVTGTGTGTYSAPSGACVTWRTGAVRNGKAVRGRTFLVPLSGTAYQADGTLDPIALGLLRSSSQSYVTADTAAYLKPQVWSRPVAISVTPPRAPEFGVQYPITGATVTDKAAVLTSRRD